MGNTAKISDGQSIKVQIQRARTFTGYPLPEVGGFFGKGLAFGSVISITLAYTFEANTGPDTTVTTDAYDIILDISQHEAMMVVPVTDGAYLENIGDPIHFDLTTQKFVANYQAATGPLLQVGYTSGYGRGPTNQQSYVSFIVKPGAIRLPPAP